MSSIISALTAREKIPAALSTQPQDPLPEIDVIKACFNTFKPSDIILG